MLTDRDIQRINNDVAGIISDWGIMIKLWTPLSESLQPNWDPIMHEMVGPISYDKVEGVPAERKDIDIAGLNTGVGGVKDEDKVLLHIPISYLVDGTITEISISDDTIIIMDDEKWRIHNMSNKQGETIITIVKMVG